MFPHRFVSLLSIGACVGVLFSVAFLFGTFDTWQDKIFDRFFLKSDTPQDILIIAIDNESINKLGQWPWPRTFFAQAIQKLQDAKIVGIDVNFSETSREGVGDDILLGNAIATSKIPVVLPLQEEESGLILSPLTLFSNHALIGVTNVALQSDGIVRFAYTTKNNQKLFAEIVSGTSFDSKNRRIAFQGPAKTFLTIPLIDLLEDRIPGRLIQGKVVLVGATAPDLHDTVETPFGTLSGVEFHANSIKMLESASFFTELPTVKNILFIVTAAFVATLTVFFIHSFLLLSSLLLLLFLAFFVLGAFAWDFYIVLPILYSSLSFFVSSSISLSYQYILESKEKRFIQKSFQYYLSGDVIKEIIDNPKKLKLGGETKKVTILFSDIRGFTTISEALSPQGLMAKLNIYFTAMTDIIMENRGLVDKYIGDAVMAFWGAPLENTDQATDACRSVIAQIKKLRELNREWEKENLPLFAIGAGLNTGSVVVGNMGSEKRFNYTIIGDEVNFASRLEGLNKAYGTVCIISESTKKEIEGNAEFKTRELDLVMVKGKKEPKRIFELLTTDINPRILAHFAEGKQHYNQGEWRRAIAEFEKALAIGTDGPSALFLERCRELLKNPPSEWSGVYEFKTK